jgi:hypothetical protein
MSPSSTPKSVAVLVLSCDKYADLWAPFFSLLARFWPDCPYPIYLVSNHRADSFSGVSNIPVGDDQSWSDGVKRALSKVSEEYVFLFLDDLFLFSKVDTAAVVKVFNWAIASGAHCVRMNPFVTPIADSMGAHCADIPCNELVGGVSKGLLYRVSTVVSLWHRDTLAALLKSGESAWDFEDAGSVRSDVYDRFYATHRNYFPVENAVIRGRWQRSVAQNVQNMGIRIDLDSRQVLSVRQTALLHLKNLRSLVLNLFPKTQRRQIKAQWVKWLH